MQLGRMVLHVPHVVDGQIEVKKEVWNTVYQYAGLRERSCHK
jgi:hypothetical protein